MEIAMTENSSMAPSFQSMDDNSSEPSSGCSVMDCFVVPVVSILCCPVVVLGSCVQVNEREEAVVLRFGKYKGTIKEPGCVCVNCVGTIITKVGTAAQSMQLTTSKMLDFNGNPLLVSGVLVYKVQDSFKATIETQNYIAFLRDQAGAVLKQVVSRYPYESSTEGQDSLKTEAGDIGTELVEKLQDKVSRSGILIESFQFDELSYAPEIAAAMLKRQQAEALVSARKKIVEGAVSTAYDAVTSMERMTGKPFSDDGKEKLVMNLLTVLCSDSDPAVTVPLK